MLTAPSVGAPSESAAFDFEEALRLAWPRAVRAAYGLLGNMHAAQDVVQDACVAAYRKRTGLRDPRAFDAWFVTITVRLAYAALRNVKPESAVFASDTSGPDVAALIDVRRAVDSLPPKVRAAVVLCDLLSYTSEEAAALLGAPAATIRNRVFRGRRALAVTLAEYAPQKRDRS